MEDKNAIVEKFIKHALIMEQSQYAGEYKKSNKSHGVHLSIRDQLQQKPELAKEVFDALLLHDNPYVLYASSMYAIVLNHRRQDAIKILEKIVDMDIKLTSFQAETALELVESGELFELHGVSSDKDSSTPQEKANQKPAIQMELLMDVHENIGEYSKIGALLLNPEQLTIWDKHKLSDEELIALKATQFSSLAISGIEKLIEDRMHALFFNFFSVVDGVGEPKLRDDEAAWLGFRLENKTLEAREVEEEFLHDQFFEAYSKWQEIKGK